LSDKIYFLCLVSLQLCGIFLSDNVVIKKVIVIKRYVFRTGQGDEEIDKALSAVLSSERRRYMKNAVLFYINMCDEFHSLRDRIEHFANNGVFVAQPTGQEAKNKDLSRFFDGLNGDFLGS